MEDMMINILNTNDNEHISIKKSIELLDKSNILEDLKESITQIQKNRLYASKFHGLYHSEKVCLFVNLLSALLNINEIDRQILTDAALYHDIGRQDDSEDKLHGFISANQLNYDWLKNPIYLDEENINMLKAICDMHSLEDNKLNIDTTIESYNIKNKERFIKLYSILKDADALDRCRFNKEDYAYLDPKHLRFDESKSLVGVAEDINNLYKIKLEQYIEKRLDAEIIINSDKEVGCLHGIGYDFFSIESILKNGILSSSEQKKMGLNIHRNYIGSNKDFWISAVDETVIKENTSAFAKFIKDGISFYAFVPYLFEGYKGKHASIANDTGYPVKSKEHEDEKFVYKKISPEQIYGMIIPKDKYNEPVNSLNYMNCNDRYQIIKQRVLHFYNSICNKLNYKNDFSNMNNLLKMYEKEYYKENVTSADEDAYFESLDSIKELINAEVQKWMQLGFDIILGKNNVTLGDALQYILKGINIEYSQLNSGDEMLYILKGKKNENTHKRNF